MFFNPFPLPLYVAPGFALASSVHFVGALSSRYPATMSWNFAQRGCTRPARAACTRCPEWIPLWWWFTTLPRAMAAALGGSNPCLPRSEATSQHATRRSLQATGAVCQRKMEGLQALNLKSSLEVYSHKHTHKHMHVRNVHTSCSTHCTFRRCRDFRLIRIA